MSRPKTACRDRTWEECNQLVETKKDNVATRFVIWMPTSGRTCCDIKALVATLETGRKQKFCRDKVSYVATRYLMSRQEIKEQYMKNNATQQFLLRH